MQIDQQYRHRQIQPPSNARYWWAMAAAIAAVLIAQAHTMPEPWGHVLALVGAVLAAAAGVGVQTRR